MKEGERQCRVLTDPRTLTSSIYLTIASILHWDIIRITRNPISPDDSPHDEDHIVIAYTMNCPVCRPSQALTSAPRKRQSRITRNPISPDDSPQDEDHIVIAYTMNSHVLQTIPGTYINPTEAPIPYNPDPRGNQ